MWKSITFLMFSFILWGGAAFADDLAITEVGLQPAQAYDQDSIVDNPVAGQQLYPSAYFSYEGSTLSSLKVRMILDGNLLCESDLANISEEFLWVFYCNSTWTVEPGSHTLEARLDPDNAVAETDETNNISSIVYNIAGGESTPTPTSTSTPSPSETTVNGNDPATALFAFLLNWSAGRVDPNALLALLESGTLPPTPSPTPGGPTATPTPTTGGGETFDFSDYFVLASNSTWHYTGIQGAGNEDDFRWTVEAGTQDVGGGRQATRIRTDTDEPTDERNGDVDFWFRESNGEVFYYGTHLAQDHDAVPSQDIILTDPLLVGRNGLMIGDTITDTGSTTVLVQTPFGNATLPGTANVEIQFTEFLPTFTTPLGTFTNVLRLVINIKVSATVPVIGLVEEELRNNTFFLKEGVGLVGQDQAPDPNDAQIQGIDEGTVSGVPVVAGK